LQDIFRIRGVAHDAVGGAEHQPVVFLKNATEFWSVRRNRDLSSSKLQGSLLFSALKTEGSDDYYRSGEINEIRGLTGGHGYGGGAGCGEDEVIGRA
jgi:hypothetical protein